LFVFDDQLHMVRGSRYDAAAPLRALAQGRRRGSQSNPLNPRGMKDELGQEWGVGTARSSGCRIHPRTS
jgi:hypothetical protein